MALVCVRHRAPKRDLARMWAFLRPVGHAPGTILNMGEVLTESLRPGRNGRRMSRALLASLLVLGVTGACSASKGAPAPQSASPATASPESASPAPSPSESPSVTVSPPTVQVRCQAERIDEWTAVPPTLDSEVLSIRLGVAVMAVNRGKVVWADCATGIWQEVLDKGGVIAELDGIPPGMAIDSRCLMMISYALSSPDVVVRHVGGVCPEPPGASSPEP